jgi:UPF0716 family protein affecting phage T7 exclusion
MGFLAEVLIDVIAWLVIVSALGSQATLGVMVAIAVFGLIQYTEGRLHKS